MAKFQIWQGFQYASVTQRSEYARICLDRVLDISHVLNMAGSEYARVTQSSKYATTWLNMSEFTIIDRVLNMSHTIYMASSLYKLMSTCREMDIFRALSKI